MATKRSPNDLPRPKNNLWDFIAYYLRFQRTQRGLSGEAAGRIINASKSEVSRIEIGAERLDGTQAALLDKAWIRVVFSPYLSGTPQLATTRSGSLSTWRWSSGPT